MLKFFKRRTQPITNDKIQNYIIPNNLGVRPNMDLEKLVQAMKKAWNNEYANQVKLRVLKSGNIHQAEYDWYELELKRFFVLSSVMMNVPMYSKKIDEIWHEMLLFTKNYQSFCEAFIGEMIHHNPNIWKESHRLFKNCLEEKIWFKYIYQQLFEIHPNTEIIYGKFPAHTQIIDLRSMEQFIKNIEEKRLFKPRNKLNLAVISKLMSKIQADFLSLIGNNYEKNSINGNITIKHKNSNNTDALLTSLLVTNSLNSQQSKETDSTLESNTDVSSSNNYESSYESSFSSCSSSTSSSSSCSSCSSCGS